MPAADIATVQALRGDLALEIARHLMRAGHSQVSAARQLDIPQPTLSKIMNGHVSELSLELLIRIAVRAGLPVLLQTGQVPEEAGAFASVGHTRSEGRLPSRVGDDARNDLIANARQLSPGERLEAHFRHSELLTALHRGGQKRSRRSR
jgi:predicted XRE-type DNA-binding protein